MSTSRAATLLMAVLCLAQAPGAFGAAIYSTSVGSSFAIGGPATVVNGPEISPVFTTGNGLATATGIVSGDGVKPATSSLSLTGSAFAPPNSSATSSYMSGHIFRIDNSLGLATIVVSFSFTGLWDVIVSATNPFTEFAMAGAFFHITGIDNEGLRIGGVLVPEFLLNPIYSTAPGPAAGMGMFAVDGTIEVPAGVISVFSVITDTSGSASAVPEPGSATLILLAGAAGWVARNWRSPGD